MRNQPALRLADGADAATGPKKEALSEEELFAGACELSDQGFGDFDVCLTVLSRKKGNMKLAKDALSTVMFAT